MLKKLAIGIGIVAALLLLAGVAAALLVDVNSYKPTIERMVTDATGRKLSIDGPLSLRLFPRLGVALPKSTLSEQGGELAFASLSSASIAVAWLPLLGGRIVIDQLSVNGLQAAVERQADGRSNIDDLLQRRTNAPEGKGDKESTGTSVAIRGVAVNDAKLSLRSADGSTIALSNLDLRIDLGAAGYQPVRVSASVRSTKPALVADVTLAADMQLDPANGRYGMRDVVGSAKGSLDRQPIEVTLAAARAAWQPLSVEVEKLVLGGAGRRGPDTVELKLTVPRVVVSESRATLDTVELALTSKGADRLDQRLELRVTGEGIKGTAAAFEATIAATFKRDAGAEHTEGKLTSPMRASLDAMSFEFPQLVAEFVSTHPNLPKKAVKLLLGGSASIDVKRELAALRLKSGLDDINLAAKLDIRGFKKPQIALDVSADYLDLDRHFPPAPKSAQTAAIGTTEGKSRPSESSVDLAALRSVHASGNARIGKLRLRGVNATDVRLVLRAKDGRLAIAPLTARLYDGTLNAQVAARADGNHISAAGTMTGVQLKPLVADIGAFAKVEGKTNLKFDLSTAGAGTAALKENLDGSMSIVVRDGAIRGIDVVETLTGALNFITARQTQTGAIDETKVTRFSSLTASTQIHQGIASSEDLQATSSVLRIAGSGRLDFVREEFDYVLRATMTASPLGADRRVVNALLSYTVPIQIAGPLDALSYRVDWVAVGADAVARGAFGGVGIPVVGEAVRGVGGLLRGKKKDGEEK
jgi:AsmA protein